MRCTVTRKRATYGGIGFEAIKGWPSVYTKRFPRRNGAKPGVMLVIAYVDDLVFLGTQEMHAEIKAMRAFISTDDPAPSRSTLCACIAYTRKH